jgi:ASC-1-like (ASCH) protein
MTVHDLKTWIPYFDEIKTGKKTFEVRKNDRNFQTGDKLLLQEYDQEKKVYTGREVCVEVTYILLGGNFGIDSGFCILGIVLCEHKVKI